MSLPIIEINKDHDYEALEADPLAVRYEWVRVEIFGDCPHAGTIATPHKLCMEMIDNLPDLNDKLVLVFFNPEFYLAILSKYPRAKIVMVTGSAGAYCAQQENGFKGIEKMILVDPFDFEAVEREIDKYEKYRKSTNNSE